VETGDGQGPKGEDRNLTFEQIHRKYEGRIYNLLLRLVGPENERDAEDLTLETFLNAWKAWARFRGDAQVYTWLYQIAYNLWKNWLKQKSRQREREGPSLDEVWESDSGSGGLSREVADWTGIPEDLALSKEFSAKLEEAVNALPPIYKEVFVLAHWEEMPYEEIARMTEQTVPAVKTRLHRAREKVRQRLEPYFRGWFRKEPEL
jgi:RNA polymerase sigma-70 factor, ECF subfamily